MEIASIFLAKVGRLNWWGWDLGERLVGDEFVGFRMIECHERVQGSLVVSGINENLTFLPSNPLNKKTK